MNIGVYIHKIIYKVGGTESYTASFIEVLQSLKPADKITLVTESFCKKDCISAKKLVEKLNSNYGCAIKTDNFFVKYINTKNIEIATHGIGRYFSRLRRKCYFVLFLKNLKKVSQKYDFFINCSNQNYAVNSPLNISVIHFPQNPEGKNGRLTKKDKKYIDSYRLFLPNSFFTASWLKKKWNLTDDKIKVIYPPVNPVMSDAAKKENQILVCGRIEASKKTDVLINAFLSSKIISEQYTLKIAGSIDNEDKKFISLINKLVKDSDGRIELIESPDRTKLEELYAQSQIFWHAKGFGETNPMLMEHFGMTTIEAMSAGCVPVVINKGGQQEIVNENCGFRWNSIDELIEYTEKLIKNRNLLKSMEQESRKRWQIASKNTFKNAIKEVLDFVLSPNIF